VPEDTLRQRLVRLIEATGPLSLAQYMHICMADPKLGYYATRPAIGAAADFITAPQVSQMFGELIGIWCASVWQAMGSPERFVLAEAGPGLGTLLDDALRATRSIPGFLESAIVQLVETSPTMIEAQRARLSGYGVRIEWKHRIEDLADGPLIFVANEFLDVLPVRQFVKSGNLWRERCIGLDANGNLISVLGPALADMSILPLGHEVEPEGAVFEHSPAREAWVETLGARIAETGGAALLIDYGHAIPGFGDTFQAIRAHANADPLAQPGMADLTSHVDFSAVVTAAMRGGAAASPVITQGSFLAAMGIAERAGRLGAGKSADEQESIRAAAGRLVLPDQMGRLFKVLALADKQTASAMNGVPPFVQV
jgi:NADH dehydrogenase [ubiquinone] 1 alpha subcomplex assembly factor 7